MPKNFQFYENRPKIVFQKKCQNNFFFQVYSFFLESIKNNVSWLNLTFLDLVLRKIFKKVFFRKIVLKTSELQNSYREKKKFL
jgi:hypothetical protein